MRSLNDWEEDGFCNLLAVLAGLKVRMRLCGHLTLRDALPSRVFVPHITMSWMIMTFAAKSIWKFKAPTKVCFFAWAATIGTIPMDDMLKRRNFSGPNRCSVCLEEEAVDHLRVHCW